MSAVLPKILVDQNTHPSNNNISPYSNNNIQSSVSALEGGEGGDVEMADMTKLDNNNNNNNTNLMQYFEVESVDTPNKSSVTSIFSIIDPAKTGGLWLVLINLILFILLVTFLAQKKGYDNGINYTSETKQKIDIAFTICFVFILVFSLVFYFTSIVSNTTTSATNVLSTAAAAAATFANTNITIPGLNITIPPWILILLIILIPIIIGIFFINIIAGISLIVVFVFVVVIGYFLSGNSTSTSTTSSAVDYFKPLKEWFIKYSPVFFGSYNVLFLVIFILYFKDQFGTKNSKNTVAMVVSSVVLCVVSVLLILFKFKSKTFNPIFSIISTILFVLFYILICGILRSQNETFNDANISNKDSIKSYVAFIVTSLNILIAFILFFNNFAFTTADWTSIIVMVISVIIIIALLVSVFDITALLINIFAAGLFALTWYGCKSLYIWATNTKEGNILELDDGASIGLLAVLFIAIIIGIFMLVFYPKKPENSPNNPDVAYKNIMIIIYVLISMIIVGLLFKGYKHISQLPSIFQSGMSYIMKLMYSLIGIILYMVFMSYFYGYGGLLTIFAKKNKDGTYDSSIDPATDKSVNPASLNKTVSDLNRSKNTAMVVLAPVTILIGLYILYRGYKVESATMDKSFDTFKKIMLLIVGIIFFSYVWTLNPAQSTFHDTIKTYFSGKMLVIDIFIAIFGIIYAGLSMAKGFVGTDVSVAPGQDKETSGPIKLIAYVILYIIFIIITSVGLSTNYFTAADGSGTKTDTRQARVGGAIFLIIFVSIVWLYFTYFELVNIGLIPKNITNLVWLKSADYIRKLSMVVVGIIISSLTIYVLVNSINGLTNKDKKKKDQGVMPFIVNLLTILVILGILYKILKVGSNPKVNQTYHLALDIIFYIPCLFITLYNNLPSMGKVSLPSMGKVNAPAMPNANDFTQLTYIKILLGVIALYIVYFYLFSYSRIYNNQNGTVILKDPVKLNKLTALSDYLKLNKLDENSTETDKSSEQGSINKFNYHYGMSFWVYLDSVNESQIDKYLTILNYGDKPKVEYNPAKNIMHVTVASNADNINAEPRIIYTLNNVLLQKWNNIIFNYIGGTVDVFYNGELVASALNVAPYMSYDGLVSGQDNGITGGICNVTYFIKSMTAKQIYYLYNILKDTEPPVMYNAGQTINNIKNNKNIQFV